MKSDISDMKVTSYWDEKPIWCRPWSIITTGCLMISFSWFFFYPILTILVFILVMLWWLLFLKIVPEQYALQRTEGDK